MGFAQTPTELPGKLVVTFLANRLQIDLIKLGLLIHLLVTNGASKVVHTPSFVESGEYVALNDLVAHKTQVAEQLVVMSLTIGKAFLLVMAMSQKRLLTLGADKVLNMPMFPEGSYNSLLDRSTTSSTDRDAHLVMAAQAVELVHVIGCEARTALDFTGVRVEFNTTRSTVEVVRVVDLASETQRLLIDHAMALVAGVAAHARSPRPRPAVVTQRLTLVSDEAQVCQLLAALLAAEAPRVPVGVHCLDHTADHKLSTLGTAWSKEHVEVVFTIFPSLKFVECPIRERPEALSTNKTLGVPQFAVGVDDLLMGLKSVPTAGAEHVAHIHSNPWHWSNYRRFNLFSIPIKET